MPVALTYNGFVAEIANLAVVNYSTVGGVVVGDDAEFNLLIPQAINFSELRIQRDLSLLAAQTSNAYAFSAGINQLQIPVSDFVTVDTIAAVSAGRTYPLTSVTKEFLQNVYGSSTGSGIPRFFAMYGGDLATGGNIFNNILVGPWPDANYVASVTGMQRLPSLNEFNTNPDASTETTFISTYLGDLMIQAGMILIAQFQRNFGQASNDPNMGPTYELEYQNLLRGAVTEEARKRFYGAAWSSAPLPTVATPTR